MVKRIFIILIFCFFVLLDTDAATISCGSTGNWNSTSTWVGGVVPTSTDDVIINGGYTVTLTSNQSCANLYVGQTTNGSLKYNNSAARTLTVSGSVIVYSNGSVSINTTSNETGHYLIIGGSLQNNGVFDLYASSNRAVTLKFIGSSNTTYSGTGSTNDIYKIEIDKGVSYSSILELTSSTFTVRGNATGGTNFLTLTNGMFKLSGSFTGSSIVFSGSDYSIGSTAGFWLNNSNYTVDSQNGYLALYGKLKIDAGIYNIGTGLDDDLWLVDASIFEINGGTLNVAESIFPTATSSSSVTITGGLVNVCTGAINPYWDAGSFHLSTDCTFIMSGGTIVIRNPSTASSASDAYDYYNFAGTKTITGGTVQYGDASTSGAKVFKVSGGYFPNLIVSNLGGNHQVNLSILNSITCEVYYNTTLQSNTKLDAGLTYGCDMTFYGNITVGSGATYYQGARSHTWKGDFTNNGTFSTTTGSVTLNGTSSQTISGTSSTTMYNCTVNNSFGVVVSKGVTINNVLTFTAGNITAATSTEPITIGTSGSVIGNGNTKCVVGYCAKNTNTTTKFTFPIGTSTTQRAMAITPSSTSATTWLAKYFSNGYSDQSITGSDLTSVSTNEYWTLDRTGAANSTIELLWNASSGVSDVAKVWVAHYNGADWEVASGEGGSGSTTSGIVTSNAGWSSYSPFTFGFSDGVLLPIELISFSGKIYDEDEVLLTWSTASEINNDYFTIERSFDGHHFTPLTRIDGAGNSTHEINYNFIDNDPVNGVNYYRLVQTDFDGEETISKLISLDMIKKQYLLVKTVNSIGQEVNQHFTGVVYDFYSDGTSVKRIQ